MLKTLTQAKMIVCVKERLWVYIRTRAQEGVSLEGMCPKEKE